MQYSKSFWHRLGALNQFQTAKDFGSFQIEEEDYLELLKQDLKQLLSQIRRPETSPYQQLIGYGLSDLSVYDPLSEHDKDLVKLAIQQTIERFEPRLQNVLVTFVTHATEATDFMEFKIYAEVPLLPNRKQVVFDSVVGTANGSIDIEITEGENNG